MRGEYGKPGPNYEWRTKPCAGGTTGSASRYRHAERAALDGVHAHRPWADPQQDTPGHWRCDAQWPIAGSSTQQWYPRRPSSWAARRWPRPALTPCATAQAWVWLQATGGVRSRKTWPLTMPTAWCMTRRLSPKRWTSWAWRRCNCAWWPMRRSTSGRCAWRMWRPMARCRSSAVWIVPAQRFRGSPPQALARGPPLSASITPPPGAFSLATAFMAVANAQFPWPAQPHAGHD